MPPQDEKDLQRWQELADLLGLPPDENAPPPRAAEPQPDREPPTIRDEGAAAAPFADAEVPDLEETERIEDEAEGRDLERAIEESATEEPAEEPEPELPLPSRRRRGQRGRKSLSPARMLEELENLDRPSGQVERRPEPTQHGEDFDDLEAPRAAPREEEVEDGLLEEGPLNEEEKEGGGELIGEEGEAPERKRRRRRRGRGRKGGAEGGPEPRADRKPEPAVPAGVVEDDDDLEPDLDLPEPARVDVDEDEDDGVLDLGEWNVPSWQELIDGLHRPR